MILYHFTDALHAAEILADGEIKPFPWEATISGGMTDPVVWADERKARFYYRFSDSLSPEAREMVADQTEVRFTIDVPEPDALPWRYWATFSGTPRREISRICNGRRPAWRVIERGITAKEWVSVCWSVNGKKLWSR